MLSVEEAQEVLLLWLSHPLALGKMGPDLQTQPLSKWGVSRQNERSGVPLLHPPGDPMLSVLYPKPSRSEVSGVQPMSRTEFSPEAVCPGSLETPIKASVTLVTLAQDWCQREAPLKSHR